VAEVRLEGLRKSYGTQAVVHGIDLSVAEGEFVVLVGPSGCGKSTILRMIAGLEDISGGRVLIGGRDVGKLDARARNLAMVFQDYALYPHMTVADNIGFGLRMRGVAAQDRAVRVAEVAELLQLSALLDRKPRALSGGQRQRVAMGRALARRADAFLFDEPLSNLDAKLRTEVRTQIRLLHRSLGMTSIFVTHDQTEAMTLADRIVCLDGGRIAQVGTPEALYNAPTNTFVAGFIGAPQINLIPAVAAAGVLRFADGQHLPVPPGTADPGGARPVLVGLRPEDLTDSARAAPQASAPRLTVEVLLSETLGSDTFVIGDMAGQRVTARCTPGLRPQPGARMALAADITRLHLFDPETRLRL
jgi:ABC-type sugar transport system ATPase subunit